MVVLKYYYTHFEEVLKKQKLKDKQHFNLDIFLYLVRYPIHAKVLQGCLNPFTIILLSHASYDWIQICAQMFIDHIRKYSIFS